ncbi:MAG TPA: radical SAM family heme chaperone HemW, partial [Flavobacterium sp.]|nr:radical SAM family heme chaperone HemW [Flavobacterium sp.]
MAGIYIHIPFCKQACHYCDFHFSTSLKKKDALISALIQEIHLRKEEIQEPVETIYFGGGTPSVLSNQEINQILEPIFLMFDVVENPEITLEANPDDLSKERIRELSQSKINRLSIGVQSFYEEDLVLMNRAHNAEEAWESLQEARNYFENISIDLIYGIPNMSMERWKTNVQKALDLGIPHISTYALTVEPKTALASLIKNGKIPMPDDGVAHEHFLALVEMLETAGFIHYELSNFGKSDFFSKNNSAYWLGKKYVGIGPSAHSFNGTNRSW